MNYEKRTIETLAYLRLWFGVIAVAWASVVGWLFTGAHAVSWFIALCGYVAWAGLSALGVILHYRIIAKIEEI